MNTAWNRWCRNLPSGTALSLYDNRITPIIITDITGRCNVRIQNPYTCTTSSGFQVCWPWKYRVMCHPKHARHLTSCLSQQLRINHNGRVLADRTRLYTPGEVRVVHVKRPWLINASESAHHFNVKLSLFMCMLAACSGSPPQSTVLHFLVVYDHCLGAVY